MTTEFEVTFARITAAKTPEDVFGKIADGLDRIQTIGRIYKRLVQVVHPDHNPSEKERSGEAMQKLTALRLEALERLKRGIYWTKTATPPPPASTEPKVVDVRGKKMMIVNRFATGDICHLYDGHAFALPLVFKIAQHPGDNDLVENEAKVLRALGPSGTAPAPGLERYVNELYDSFLLKSRTQTRRANVFVCAPEFRTLAEVQRAYPRGVDYRDLAWMFKRVLAALWYLHRSGYVHGAILPEHVMIHPLDHGARLLDFSYAVPAGQTVRAISGPRRDHYAPEILAKQPVGVGTDIFMAARTFRPMLAKDTPPRIVGFFDACMLMCLHRRPQNAGDLHEEFDKLLAKHAGPPKYRPFVMPPEGGRS